MTPFLKVLGVLAAEPLGCIKSSDPFLGLWKLKNKSYCDPTGLKEKVQHDFSTPFRALSI